MPNQKIVHWTFTKLSCWALEMSHWAVVVLLRLFLSNPQFSELPLSPIQELLWVLLLQLSLFRFLLLQLSLFSSCNCGFAPAVVSFPHSSRSSNSDVLRCWPFAFRLRPGSRCVLPRESCFLVSWDSISGSRGLGVASLLQRFNYFFLMDGSRP